MRLITGVKYIRNKGIGVGAAVAVTAIVVAVLVGSGVYFITRPEPEPEPEPENTIKIGVVGPMEYIQGKYHWHGAKMAAEEINAKGGIKVGDEWRPIELVKIDSKEIQFPGEAGGRLEDALDTHDPDFLTGMFRSEAALSMQEVAMDYEKIFLGAGASESELTARVGEDYERYKYTFRVTPLKDTVLAQASFRLLATAGVVVGQNLGVGTENKPLRVAIVSEDREAGDAIAGAAESYIGVPGTPYENYTHVGTWRPSDTADEDELYPTMTDIDDAEPHMIFTYLSGPVGVPYAKLWGELEIPAASVGINVEAQEKGFLEATQGYGEYMTTLNTYDNVPITPVTIPFYESFVERTGRYPIYNAGTYDAIYLLAEAIIRTESLDDDKLVEYLSRTSKPERENITQYLRPGLKDGVTTAGRIEFNENHDVIWRGDRVTALGTQWQNGEIKTFWPYHDPVFGHQEGAVPYQVPDWVVEEWT